MADTDSGGKAVGVGIEHVGITVPDVEEATRFFREVFGAELLYDLIVPAPDGGVPEGAFPPERLERVLGTAPGAGITAVRWLRLGNGANVELFHFAGPDQRPAARASDLGLQHLGIVVEDIRAAGARVAAAGGEVFEGPLEMPGAEGGPGNYYWYTRAPWGAALELVQLHSPQAYEQESGARRWHPASAA